MRRGTIFIIVFILAAAGIIGVSLFLQNQPPVEISIAVDPLAAEWAREAAARFNDADNRISNGTRRVRVSISSVSDVDVWRSLGAGGAGWSVLNHPDGWLAASSVSTSYSSLPFEVVSPSTARTVLVWVGFSSRVQALTNNGEQALDWPAVINAAQVGEWAALGGQASWQFVRLGIPQPGSTIQGTATLFSAAAAHSNKPDLDANSLRGEYYAWMRPFVERQQQVTGDVVTFMASRGPGTVALIMAPESLVVSSLSGLQRHEPITIAYPEYNFLFDFPLAAWLDAETPTEKREGVAAFGNWLLQPAQQNSAMRFGLRPAQADPSSTEQAFAAGMQAGLVLEAPLVQSIQAPSLGDTQGLLAWYERAGN